MPHPWSGALRCRGPPVQRVGWKGLHHFLNPNPGAFHEYYVAILRLYRVVWWESFSPCVLGQFLSGFQGLGPGTLGFWRVQGCNLLSLVLETYSCYLIVPKI